jgi:hypothetical protein
MLTHMIRLGAKTMNSHITAEVGSIKERWEVKEFQRLERLGLTYQRYQNVSAETLLLGGSRSPAYLRKALLALVKTMPHAHRLELPGLDHNAPDQNAPQVIAAELKRFFL